MMMVGKSHSLGGSCCRRRHRYLHRHRHHHHHAVLLAFAVGSALATGAFGRLAGGHMHVRPWTQSSSVDSKRKSV